MRRLFLDERSARIAKAEKLRCLVKGFADGVVDRAADAEVIADAAHAEDLRVAAGREEQAIGKGGRVGEPRGERVRLQVVDRDQRLVVHEGDRLGHGQPNDHATDQPRPGGGGNAVERGERKLRLVHRFGDDGIQRLDMGAGGDFRHHAAESRMLADLRENDIGQDAAVAFRISLHHGGSRFVAGGFDAEDDHRCIICLRHSGAER